MEFLHPTALWGLLALGVPLIIHLLSKKESKVVKFGSLRFLEALESESARSIQLSQYGLLASRWALLALICLATVQPFLNSDKEESTTYWIDKHIYESGDYDEVLSDIDEENIQLFSIDDITDSDHHRYPSLWTLIDNLNNQQEPSEVYTYSHQKDFTGAPVSLADHIHWNIIPEKKSPSKEHIFTKDDNQLIWSIDCDEHHLSVRSSDTDAAALRATTHNSKETSNLMSVDIKGSSPDQVEQLQRLIGSIEEFLPYKLNLSPISLESSDIYVAISDNVVQDTDADILWIPSDDPLEINRPTKGQLVVEGGIDRQSILDSNLPVQLASFFNQHITDIHAQDIRVLDPRKAIHSPNKIVTPAVYKATLKEQQPISIYLFGLFILVFLVERFLSYKSESA